jgi:hypothetical protein
VPEPKRDLLLSLCAQSGHADERPALRGQQGAVSAKARRFCSAGEERPRPRQIKPLRFDRRGCLYGDFRTAALMALGKAGLPQHTWAALGPRHSRSEAERRVAAAFLADRRYSAVVMPHADADSLRVGGWRAPTAPAALPRILERAARSAPILTLAQRALLCAREVVRASRRHLRRPGLRGCPTLSRQLCRAGTRPASPPSLARLGTCRLVGAVRCSS